ncbi:16S rRNA (guanine(527)-N(7))-methyltransferase RsmG [Mangrovicella endophytica]|uniref:16S rRNA (guanine(527)-N(7))-methyltransferase RsmG n=1 Tax=Mangrovicella endophytica TaxID=2066697 RepID=UPI000C9E7120|nr:16S rRNA (guanine(527)-N(7))-methyltransferase RsmG [Mangrovicella endophytica]
MERLRQEGRDAFIAAHSVSRETQQRLDRYVELLVQWQAHINLISPATLPEIWQRHVADSAQLHALAPDVRHWVDLGSGGGLPGIVVAILNADQDGARIELVESNAKKAAFLRTALRELNLAGSVHATRIEDAGAVIRSAEAISARALAPLSELFELLRPNLPLSARCYFAKGRNHEQEIADAAAHWRFTMVKHQSDAAAGSVILELSDIEPLPRTSP